MSPLPVTVPARDQESLLAKLEGGLTTHAAKLAVATTSCRWSYADLDAASARCASALQRNSAARLAPIALLMTHEAPLIAAILGVVRSGGFYLALNPATPPERLTEICNKVRPQALVTDAEHIFTARRAWEEPERLFLYDDLLADTPEFVRRTRSDTEPFALFYTSGSLNKPKPLVYTHGGTQLGLSNHSRSLKLTADDRLTLLSPCSAAASVSALFGAILNGASVHPRNPVREGLHSLASWIESEQITVYHSVPSLFRQLLFTLEPGQILRSVRAVKLGGEPVFNSDIDLFRQHFPPDSILINGLGMTEANGNVCHAIITQRDPTDGVTVAIGEPVDGIDLKLVDASGRDVSTGTMGEIAVRGQHLAPAFWTGSSVEAYGLDDEGWFRSGDLGRVNARAQVEHLGRKDDQLKRNGQWVSFAEIEAALMNLPAVRQAVAVPVTPSANRKRIAAFVSWKDAPLPEAALRRLLRAKLPSHSLPDQFFERTEFPLLPNGKVDRRALSQNAAYAWTKTGPERRHTADPLVVQLLRLWQQVLERDDIGAGQNFFALGGDSLAAAAIMAGIHKFFRVDLPMSALVQAPTVNQLARLIRRSRHAARFAIIAHRLRGTRPPLYYVPGAGCEGFEPHLLSCHLGDDQPVLAFQPPGLHGWTRYHRSIEQTAQAYLAELRLHQPHGPYYLCGSSMGGVVAFEMGRRLVAADETVAFLGLFDSYGGDYPKPRLPPRERDENGFRRFISRRASSLPIADRTLKAELKARLLALDSALGCSVFARDYDSRVLCAREICARARRRYEFQPFNGRIDLFRSTDHQPSVELFEPDPWLGWQGMAVEGIEVHDVPGGHGDYLREPHVIALARKLSEALERARSRNRPAADARR